MSEGSCTPGRVPIGWRPPGNGRPRRAPGRPGALRPVRRLPQQPPELAGAGPRDWPRPFAGTETPSLGGTAESQAPRLLPAAGPLARRVGVPGEHAVAHPAQAALLPSAGARHGGAPAGGACGRTAVMRAASGRQVTKRSRSPGSGKLAYPPFWALCRRSSPVIGWAHNGVICARPPGRLWGASPACPALIWRA